MMTREERVLTIPSATLANLHVGHGFHAIRDIASLFPRMFSPSTVGTLARSKHEEDEAYRALVSYILVRHAGWYYSYERAKGSDPRLQARRSIGFGGHANSQDMDGSSVSMAVDILAIMERAARRELNEEFNLDAFYQETIRVELLGLLNDQSNTVGRTHLGFVYCIEAPTTGMNYRPDAKAKRGEWMSPASLWETQRVHEHWSKMLITESRIIPIPNTTWRARA